MKKIARTLRNLILKGIDLVIITFTRFSTDIVPVYYFNEHNNWGDQLNWYLIEKITGKKVVRVSSDAYQHVLGIGSVIGYAKENSIVWGSGLVSDNQKFIMDIEDIRFCRGPLTRQRLISQGYNVPQIYGDPGLLISKFYKPSTNKSCKLGFVPHYVDKSHPFVLWMKQQGCLIIDIQSNIEDFIDDLCRCEAIISTSLHGLIASDAYDIPNRWIELSNDVVGGGFKFNDYHSGVGVSHDVYRPTGNESLEEMISMCVLKDIEFDHELILNLYPKEVVI